MIFATVLRVLKPLIAVLLALLVGALVITLAGADPLTAYAALFHGAFVDYYGLGATLVKTGPILLAGLAVVIPLRVGLLNVGGEGQIYIGGLATAAVALYCPADWPGPVVVGLSILAGALGGGVWAGIAGYLKAYRGLNEVIVTILLNYVAINMVSYVAGGPMMQPGAPYPYSKEIRDDVWLPWIMDGTDAHAGVIVALALAIIVFLALRFTTVGYAMNAIGKSPRAAEYAGMSVKHVIVGSMFTAGAIAGLAGAFEVLGLKYRLYHLFNPGYGYDGIVAAFLAGLNPLALPIAALFVGGLKAGAAIMQRAIGLESTVVEVIQGLVIVFVAASLAIGRFRLPAWRKGKPKGSD